jgi:N utilization substance protein B
VKTRRRAREAGLQLLYQLEGEWDSLDEARLETQLEKFRESFELPEKAAPQAEALARGVVGHREEIDRTITEHSPRWRLERMARVDRNVLRLALYELLFDEEVPDKVAIDEAVELAKRFGSESSGAFVNGVLDAAARARRERESA